MLFVIDTSFIQRFSFAGLVKLKKAHDYKSILNEAETLNHEIMEGS